MSNIRSRVAKKTANFVRKAQQVPTPQPPGVPAPAPVAPAPTPGVQPTAPVAPKPPIAAPGAPSTPAKPPAAPGAPAQPTKSKEEIEQGVEQDIRRRKEQEKKIDDLDTKVTSLSDQLEGLTKSLNKFINTMQQDMGDSTEFDNKFKDLQDSEAGNEKPSSSEFGLGKDDSLVVSKEGQTMSNKAALRKARKARLQAKKLFEDTEAPDKKYKQQVPAPQVNKLKSAPGDWKAYDIKASDMAMELNASKDEWVIMSKHDNKPFFKLHPSTITAEVFATREFAEQVIRDVRDLGIKAAMEKYAAEPLPMLPKKNEVDTTEKPNKADLLKKKLLEKKKPVDKKEEKPLPKPKEDKPGLGTEIEEDACSLSASDDPNVPAEEPTEETPAQENVPEDPKEEVTASLHDVQRRFVRAFRLALAAQHKNLADNPLKAAWFEVLKGMDVENPERIIEATFARAASEHFEVALAKTAEFLELADESFVELESQIGDMHVSPPMTEEESVEVERKEKAASLRARASRSSLPLSTVTDHKPVSVGETIASVLPKPKLHGVRNLLG
jgi:hypothetical protein